MRQAVRDAAQGFNEDFEGRIPHMYLCAASKVTCAVGNMIEPSEVALHLDWRRLDGSPAAKREIADEWCDVKWKHPELAGAGWRPWRAITRLRLTDAAIDALATGALDNVDTRLGEAFPGYEAACCDAQLGLISMVYALGMGRLLHEFPRLCAAVRAEDWAGADAECHIDEKGNAPIHPRNVANHRLFANAAQVAALELDLDVLYYPRDLSAECPPAA